MLRSISEGRSTGSRNFRALLQIQPSRLPPTVVGVNCSPPYRRSRRFPRRCPGLRVPGLKRFLKIERAFLGPKASFVRFQSSEEGNCHGPNSRHEDQSTQSCGLNLGEASDGTRSRGSVVESDGAVFGQGPRMAQKGTRVAAKDEAGLRDPLIGRSS